MLLISCFGFFLCYILYKCMLVSFVFVFLNEFSATSVGHHKMVQTFPLFLILYVFIQMINAAC